MNHKYIVIRLHLSWTNDGEIYTHGAKSKARTHFNVQVRGTSQSWGELPSESKLAQTFEVGRSTKKIALASLEDAGLIFRRQGIGIFGIIDVHDGNVYA